MKPYRGLSRTDEAIMLAVAFIGVLQLPWHIAKALWRQR